MVVLISSLFVYNTTANIDEKSISELSLAAHLSSSIAVNSAVNKDSILTELAPKFIWVLRDFTLEKVNPETGEEMSSNEYLELCLRNKISGRNSAENNFIRENILKYFHRRECITLPRPVESEEDLRSLNKLPFANLKANFRSEFLQLRNKIYNESNAKKINGMKLTGRTLANFLTEFVNSINSGVVPNITNAWDSVISTDIESNYDKAVKFYKENVKSPEGNIFSFLYDVRHKSVLIYEKVLAFNIEIMTNRSYNDIYQNYRSKLFNVISAHEKKILQDDKDKWNRISLDTIRLGNKNIQSKLFNNKYSSEDGFSKLREDLLDMMQNYENKTKESSHSDDKLKILVKVLNDQTRESLYYMVTNIK